MSDLKSRAGHILYHELPEEYRYRDNPSEGELGDLEAYLHAFGAVLDLTRETLEQAYGDAFAETADNGRSIQTWLIPYLADLIGAELMAPNPAHRAEELNQTIGWFKTKGTLDCVDTIADTISGVESVVVEGWRKVLITPSPQTPPFTAAPDLNTNEDPGGRPLAPLGTPDLRTPSRAIVDPNGTNPLYYLARNGGQYWKPSTRRGVPCFPASYDDVMVRTPDLRDPARHRVGPSAKRVVVHVRPPQGLIREGMPTLQIANAPDPANPLGLDLASDSVQIVNPHTLWTHFGQPADTTPAQLRLEGDLTLPADCRVQLEDVILLGRLRVSAPVPEASTRAHLRRCAIEELSLMTPTDPSPLVEANDCLIGEIISAGGFAQLVETTVLGETHLERLWASDCIFQGDLIDVTCAEGGSCIRFSRVPDLSDLAGCYFDDSPNNTDAPLHFVDLYFEDPGGCTLRAARFGEPGCAVLDLDTDLAIREGAENDGEMGVGNHLYLCAQLRAMTHKLKDFLPLGQDIALHYDARLARPPAQIAP
ncbi:hypothetical protein [Woodsholea maritima]|uniref:hypothetical protein n=1 Tax=Woodsholea maritima TaxID=240237 RepID=UPI00037AF4D4|nr:hypothetical protein [Woodsholea maritima]